MNLNGIGRRATSIYMNESLHGNDGEAFAVNAPLLAKVAPSKARLVHTVSANTAITCGVA